MPRSSTTAAADESPPTDAIFVSVKDAQKMLGGLSRSQTYDLLWRGVIESRMFGRRRLVVLDSLKRFAEGLPVERAEE